MLNVLGWLVDLEPIQEALLEKICSGPTISADELQVAGAFEENAESKKAPLKPAEPRLFND